MKISMIKLIIKIVTKIKKMKMLIINNNINIKNLIIKIKVVLLIK